MLLKNVSKDLLAIWDARDSDTAEEALKSLQGRSTNTTTQYVSPVREEEGKKGTNGRLSPDPPFEHPNIQSEFDHPSSLLTETDNDCPPVVRGTSPFNSFFLRHPHLAPGAHYVPEGPLESSVLEQSVSFEESSLELSEMEWRRGEEEHIPPLSPHQSFFSEITPSKLSIMESSDESDELDTSYCSAQMPPPNDGRFSPIFHHTPLNNLPPSFSNSTSSDMDIFFSQEG